MTYGSTSRRHSSGAPKLPLPRHAPTVEPTPNTLSVRKSKLKMVGQPAWRRIPQSLSPFWNCGQNGLKSASLRVDCESICQRDILCRADGRRESRDKARLKSRDVVDNFTMSPRAPRRAAPRAVVRRAHRQDHQLWTPTEEAIANSDRRASAAEAYTGFTSGGTRLRNFRYFYIQLYSTCRLKQRNSTKQNKQTDKQIEQYSTLFVVNERQQQNKIYEKRQATFTIKYLPQVKIW